MICRKGNKLLQGSQASPNHAAQPLPATNGEAKVFGLLSQLLDRFAPEEPQITYVQRPAGSHAQGQLALPAPQPAQPAEVTPAATVSAAVPVANQSQEATAAAATTAPESQTPNEAGICHICSLPSNQAEAEIAYCMYTVHMVTE